MERQFLRSDCAILRKQQWTGTTSRLPRPMRRGDRDFLGYAIGITIDRNGRRIQPVDATVWLNISAGVLKPSVFLGLSFNCLATALSLACE